MATKQEKFSDWNKKIAAVCKNSGKDTNNIPGYSGLFINIWKYDNVAKASARKIYLQEMTEDLLKIEKKLLVDAKNIEEIVTLFKSFRVFIQEQSKIVEDQLPKTLKITPKNYL